MWCVYFAFWWLTNLTTYLIWWESWFLFCLGCQRVNMFLMIDQVFGQTEWLWVFLNYFYMEWLGSNTTNILDFSSQLLLVTKCNFSHHVIVLDYILMSIGLCQIWCLTVCDFEFIFSFYEMFDMIYFYWWRKSIEAIYCEMSLDTLIAFTAKYCMNNQIFSRQRENCVQDLLRTYLFIIIFNMCCSLLL